MPSSYDASFQWHTVWRRLIPSKNCINWLTSLLLNFNSVNAKRGSLHLLYVLHSDVFHWKCQSEEHFKPCIDAVKSAHSKRNDSDQHVMICTGSIGRCFCGCQCSQVRKRQFGWEFLLSVVNGYVHKECCVTWVILVLITVVLTMLPCTVHTA